ncbi:MAG: DNA cytosine methyltransferase [Verrucomicrobiota bacterium]
MELVLSLFTGAGLLDRGFRESGFCVVSAGDILTGQDVRDFAPASHIFNGVVGGSPCQEFSKAFRGKATGYSLELFQEFCRVVRDAAPNWFLLENVTCVPDVKISGYKIQRFNLNAKECGVRQNRLRCFQFGSCDAARLVLHRAVISEPVEKCCMATEGTRTKKARRTFEDFCELQGLPRNFLSGSDLPQWLKYQLVGNGVPVAMARVVATAIKRRAVTKFARLCICQCGREVKAGQTLAIDACRQRMSRKRKRERDAGGGKKPGPVTVAASLPMFPKLPYSTEQLKFA